MANPPDSGKGAKPGVPTVGSGSDPKAESEKRSGRVSYDERGNSVWEWQLETGVYSRDVSTQRLRKLELGDLSIAETATHKRPPGLGNPSPSDKKSEPPKAPPPGGGFNPYDSASSARNSGGNPYDNARAAGQRLQPKPAASIAPRKPMDLKRLEEWMNIRKRVMEQKKNDDD
jgi:hypothetical protein